jgi:hypothetical protein
LNETLIHQHKTWKSKTLTGVAYIFWAYAAAQVFTIQHFSDEQRSLVPLVADSSQVIVALQSISGDERKTLISRERQRLLDEPFDRFALVNLSVLHGLDGDQAKGNSFTFLAAKRSLRDLPAQAASIQLLLNERDYSAALIRLDGVLRSHPDRSKEFYPLLISLAESEDGLMPVAKLLNQMPPWRNSFLQFAARDIDRANTFHNIMFQIKENEGVVDDDALRLNLKYLIVAKKFDTAYFVWLDFLMPDDLRRADMIFDGDFRLQPRNMIFDWNIIPAKNADISVAPRLGRASDSVLKLDFLNSREHFANVFQTLHLAKGHYRLQGEVRAENLVTTGGLLWQVTCFENNTVLGQGSQISSTGPWTPFTFDFEVAIENCTMQRLTLVSEPNFSIAQIISGQIYFDSFQLERLP